MFLRCSFFVVRQLYNPKQSQVCSRQDTSVLLTPVALLQSGSLLLLLYFWSSNGCSQRISSAKLPCCCWIIPTHSASRLIV